MFVTKTRIKRTERVMKFTAYAYKQTSVEHIGIGVFRTEEGIIFNTKDILPLSANIPFGGFKINSAVRIEGEEYPELLLLSVEHNPDIKGGLEVLYAVEQLCK